MKDLLVSHSENRAGLRSPIAMSKNDFVPPPFKTRAPLHAILPLLAGAVVMGGSLITLRMHDQFSAPQEFLNAPLVTPTSLLLAAFRGLVMGVMVFLLQKSWSNSHQLARANRELEKANRQLREDSQSLHQSEMRFRTLFSGNPCPMWIFDCQSFAIEDVNEAALRQYGYTRQQFLSLSALDLRPPEETQRFLARLQDADQGYGCRGVWRHIRHDGTHLLAEICVFRFHSEGRIKELVLAQDVTTRVETREALQHSEEALQSLLNSAPFGICNTSLKRDRFIDCNPAMCQLLGYTREEMLSLKLSTQLYPDPTDRARMLELLQRSGKLDGYEATLLRKDGKAIRVRGWVVLKDDSHGEPDLVNIYLQDLTEHSALEQQVRQVQKLEAVGRLAGGIAHDFNNILVVIRLSTELMLGEVTVDSPLGKPLLQVLSAADRAAALTRQLLAFGRQQVMQSRTLNLNAVVTDTLHLLRRTIGEDIELITHLNDDLLNTRLDPDQLGQIIMNLAINARDAMPKGGSLHIETSNVELDETYVKTHGPVRPGKYVLLAVSDTGSGMPKAILPRIFDPFFTTKGVGEGTGLGLDIVHRIIRNLKGNIRVDSRPGRTVFQVSLPR